MTTKLKLYQITFDGQSEFVEAASFGDAVRIWRVEMSAQAEPDETYEDEEPEQVVLANDAPVIREAVAPDECEYRCGVRAFSDGYCVQHRGEIAFLRDKAVTQ